MGVIRKIATDTHSKRYVTYVAIFNACFTSTEAKLETILFSFQSIVRQSGL